MKRALNMQKYIICWVKQAIGVRQKLCYYQHRNSRNSPIGYNEKTKKYKDQLVTNKELFLLVSLSLSNMVTIICSSADFTFKEKLCKLQNGNFVEAQYTLQEELCKDPHAAFAVIRFLSDNKTKQQIQSGADISIEKKPGTQTCNVKFIQRKFPREKNYMAELAEAASQMYLGKGFDDACDESSLRFGFSVNFYRHQFPNIKYQATDEQQSQAANVTTLAKITTAATSSSLNEMD